MCPSEAATELLVPGGAAGETASHSGGEAADHLSALPDDLLHRILSYLRAWEVVRTCVLARRWRHLWASATCLDLRTRYSTRDFAPDDLRGFVSRLFLSRNASVPVDTLRLQSSEMIGAFSDDDSSRWISVSMEHSARVIHVVGHRRFPALLKGVSFVSSHLKILKLSYARLDHRILGQLSSSCTCLEELHLKDCLVTGDEIVSASLRTLVMLKCKIDTDFSVAAPNLVQLRLITPYGRVPLLKHLGSLVTGTIIVDDYFLSDDISEDDAYDDTTDDDDDEHVTDQEDCDETTDDDDGDGPEHIVDQEDSDQTADNRDNSNHGSEHITSEEDSDEPTDDDNTSCGSGNINGKEDCDETWTSDDDDDNTSGGSENINDKVDYDETADDDGCNCGYKHIIDQEDCDETSYDDKHDSNRPFELISDQEGCDETTDDEGDGNEITANRDTYKIGDDFGYISEDDSFEENTDEEDGSDNSNDSNIGYRCGGQKDNGHDSDMDSDDNTYEYSEIAKEEKHIYHADSQSYSKDTNYHSYENTEISDSECLGGHNILRSLSNVTSLGLLTDAGEVVLSRELKRCPTFSNLRTLSLGEWCMASDFDAVIFLLQHSPNIERLFLQLKLNFDIRSRKALQTDIKLQGRSFTCKDLQIVKIKCSKDDVRVHKLANLFVANGIPLKKILVRRSGSAYLRAQELTEEALHELMLFGPKWTNTKFVKFLERSTLVTEIRL
ncbi:uncharacterized protein LOC124673438 [Lolium rigidum]|uniref:uncharacterized protein LOC124673438 n=1 Tax=Lolium rigidum TaxID=89674 RepID=UPI001F5C8756|nr:uncharacterized protein LOC124673438 [Lolium rigidum]